MRDLTGASQNDLLVPAFRDPALRLDRFLTAYLSAPPSARPPGTAPRGVLM